VLPPLPAMPRPTRFLRRFEPAGGWRSWILIGMGLLLLLLDRDQVRHAGQHPPDLGPVGKGVGLADAPEPEGPERAPLLRLGADGGADLRDGERAGHQ